MQSRRALTDHEKRVVAYHEAGHALCGELLPSVDRVHRISIVPHGRALGYTLNLPEEDRYLKTREELIDFMTMLLGGRAVRAARVRLDHHRRLGRPQAGRRDRPHAMVHEYAMGTGSSSLSRDRPIAARRRPPGASATRRCASWPTRRIEAATAIIDRHRVQLDELAATLLANEVLERGDIDRIMGDVPRAAPSRIGQLSVAAATAVNPAAHPARRGPSTEA